MMNDFMSGDEHGKSGGNGGSSGRPHPHWN